MTDDKEFLSKAARLSRLRAKQALIKGDPNSAHEHLKEARKASREADGLDPGKVHSIESQRRKRRRGD